MGLYLEEGAVKVTDDSDVLAVRQGGKVEVWSADGEHRYGTLPESATAEDVAYALTFYFAGRVDGHRAGRLQAQGVMRLALGLDTGESS